MQEIEENGFNLNISRYISTAEPEKEIDLKDVHTKLMATEEAIKLATDKHNAFLRELGLDELL